MDEEQLRYLVEGLVLFGLGERQILGVLNILRTWEQREELIEWLVELSQGEDLPNSSEILWKAVEIEESHRDETTLQ